MNKLLKAHLFRGWWFFSLMSLVVTAAAEVESAKALNDPTRPLSYRAAGPVSVALSLQATFVRSSGSSAIINGRNIEVGQSISGWRLVSVSNTAAKLSSGSETRVVTLRQKLINKS